MSNDYQSPYNWHRNLLEGRAALFAVLTTVGVSIGGIVEILPMYSASLGPEQMTGIEPYTALEVAGRDIYVAEGCYNCHSQMIRPFRSETLRYGPWTRAGEYAYDHPFQLGSRRIGPDLQRVGGKYPDLWHYEHMKDPRATSPGSNMPAYPWLYEKTVDTEDIQASMKALATVGVPYSDADINGVGAQMKEQGEKITGSIAQMGGAKIEANTEIVALIAYLQRLGQDGKASLVQADQPSEDAVASAGEAE